jgi:hypothetical protein
MSSKELKVVLFGATGMIGSGVLQSCLEEADVSAVLVVGRSSCGVQHPKLQEILHKDFYDYSAIESRFAGYNACLFPLGVTSVGMNEADYSRVTYDLTLAAAEAMLRQSPGCSFCYVSGQNTDSSEKGGVMWARVKGRIENKLLSMPFQPAVMFRPGGIQPMRGVKSKTRWYAFFYAVMAPLFPILVRNFPAIATTSERLGRAMLKAARGEAGMSIIESKDINLLGA